MSDYDESDSFAWPISRLLRALLPRCADSLPACRLAALETVQLLFYTQPLPRQHTTDAESEDVTSPEGLEASKRERMANLKQFGRLRYVDPISLVFFCFGSVWRRTIF